MIRVKVHQSRSSAEWMPLQQLSPILFHEKNLHGREFQINSVSWRTDSCWDRMRVVFRKGLINFFGLSLIPLVAVKTQRKDRYDVQ